METNRRFHPAWLIEASADPDDHQSITYELFGMLSNEAYQAYCFDGEKLHQRKPGEQKIDYFFLRDKYILRLQKAELLTSEIG